MIHNLDKESFLENYVFVTDKYIYYLIVNSICFSICLFFFAGSLFFFNIWTNIWLYIVVGFIFFITIWDLIYSIFKSLRYRIKVTSLVLEIVQGRIFLKKQIIFLNKIYSVEFRQNILMKYFDVAKIIIKTVDHDIEVQGLSTLNASELKDWMNNHASS